LEDNAFIEIAVCLYSKESQKLEWKWCEALVSVEWDFDKLQLIMYLWINIRIRML